MAEFKNITITKQGQALMAKILSGTGNITFTRIDVSDMVYSDDQLEELMELADVKQSVPINKVTKINEAAVKLEAALTNKELKIGYHMQTIGLYACDDAEEEEILYGVMTAKVAAWIPPYNGVGESCAIFNMYVSVGNANHVSLDIASGVYATVTMLNEVKDISEGKIDKKANQILSSLGDSTIFNLETGYYPVSKEAITEAMANAGNAPAINPDSDCCNVLGAYLTVVKYDKNTIYCNLKVINDLQGHDGIQLQMKEFVNMFFGTDTPLTDGRLCTGWIENSDEQLSYGSSSPARNSKVRSALDTKVNVADVEASLRPTSTNPIQSKAVYQAIKGLGGSGGSSSLTRIWSGNARTDLTSINILVNSDWYYYTSNYNMKVLTLGLNIHRTPADSFYESPKLIFVNIYQDLNGYGNLIYSSRGMSATYVHETLCGSTADSTVTKVDVSMFCIIGIQNGQDTLQIYTNYGARTNYCYITDVFVVVPKDEGGI